MKKIIGMLLIAVAVGYGFFNYHFVLFDNSLKILKKSGARCEHTFVDARGMKKLELVTKSDLLAAGIADVINQVDQ